MKKEKLTESGYYWYRVMPMYPTWGMVEICFPNGELSGHLSGYLDELNDNFEFVGPIKEPSNEVTAAQQQELDAWVAWNEKMLNCNIYGDERMNACYQRGFNDAAENIAEVIRQGNLSWEDYQEWKRKFQP